VEPVRARRANEFKESGDLLKRPLLLYGTIFVQTVIGVWALFFWKRSTFSQRCIIILLVEMSLSSIIEHVMGMYHIHNLWVMHISTLIEFLIIMTMFYGWKKTRTEKRLLILLSCAFVLIWSVSKIFLESFEQMDTYSYAVAQMIYIAFAVSLLFDVLKDSQTLAKHDSRLWIASGIIIYSTGTLLVVSLFNVIVTSMPQLFITVWHINWVLVIITALLYARGIWCQVPLEIMKE
jgi:hypothetical protein